MENFNNNYVVEAMKKNHDEHIEKILERLRLVSDDIDDDTLMRLNPKIQPIKFIDLCCGIGSFHYSFKQRDWKCVLASDINDSVRETYKLNYGIEPVGDIKKIKIDDIPDYDILCAGFPCQSFSQCGNQKGFDDSRGHLFFDIMKIVRETKPKIVIFENVRGLISNDNGKTFEKIIQTLSDSNYVTAYKVLDCSDYGIPQMRKRLFMISIRKDLSFAKDIEKVFDLTEFKTKISLSEFMGRNFKKKLAYTIRCGGKNSPIDDKHNWDGYYVDDKEYRLTITDCLKLQGFPSDFVLCGTKKDMWDQVGNTIPTIFTKLLCDSIMKIMQ